MEEIEKNNEEKKMTVCVMTPLLFMHKNEVGYLAASNWIIVYKGDSLDAMKVYLYIMKNAMYTMFQADSFFKIERISDDNNGFFIHFNKTTHYPLYSFSDIKEIDYLPPIEIDYHIDDGKEKNIDISTILFDQIDFEILIDLIWKKMENGNFSKSKKEIEPMVKAIPASLLRYVSSFDKEGILEMKHNLDLEKDESLEMLVEGEKKRYIQLIYQTVSQVLDKAKTELAEKEAKVEIANLDDLSILELNEELVNVIKSSRFELAAAIRDKIKEKENNNNGLIN